MTSVIGQSDIVTHFKFKKVVLVLGTRQTRTNGSAILCMRIVCARRSIKKTRTTTTHIMHYFTRRCLTGILTPQRVREGFDGVKARENKKSGKKK